ncbi:uncharacterized protein LACBIDRAFT_317219 [Laccaria bicolor S238N-H82]|uniref:Predicted protein n=1 Tax=Laccaria bicolor (strain S238N-H82 / ATCC MYA-4686) TaxID=486041 RepID=B0D4P5_LACBS|nr:uncharacterized protein LACBIDRAFT_317219 [Laccaria bicolor S238N-H82]EDR10598.1 predicted protein [Laccaria bicolor S238N-H82]|eukprot:XP_001879048.1 predicted protein [Laccaria bicolor S238N-H82]
MEIRVGLAKGLQFYADLTELTVTLGSATRSFVSERTRREIGGREEVVSSSGHFTASTTRCETPSTPATAIRTL